MRKSKTTTLVIAFAIMVLVTGTLTAAGTNEATNKEPVELTWVHWFTQSEQDMFIDPAIRKFEELHPDIKIKTQFYTNKEYFKQLAVDIAIGGEADIVTLDSGDGFSAYYTIRQGGSFTPLGKYLNSYVSKDDTDLGDVDLLDSYQIDGQIVALPWFTYAAPVTVYRKSLLKEAGIDPTDLAQWTTYYEAAKKLTRDTDKDGKIDVYGFAHQTEGSTLIRWWTMPWLWQMDGGIFPSENGPYTADRLVWNSDANVQACEYLSKMINECGPKGKYTVIDAYQLFANGNLATMQASSWCFDAYERIMGADYAREDIGVVQLPSNGERLPVTTTWGNPLAISTNCEHPQEAFEFIAFLHGEFAQNLLPRIPVNRTARATYAEKHPFQAGALDMVLKSELRSVPDIIQWRELDNIIQKSLENAFLGTMPVKQALDWGQQEMIKTMNH